MALIYGILNNLGLYAFLSLVPFIIIYLRKPRPVEKVFPSLLFFMEELKSQRNYYFIEKLIRNLLFFIQLFTILLLSIAAAEPYLVLPREDTSANTILVIDGSASMKTKVNAQSTRFEQAIEEAKNHLDGRITIILTANVPSVELEKGNKAEALNVLKTLKAKDTPSNIEAGMSLAQATLGNEKANIYVLSDFITTDENDQPLQAKRLLSAQGNSVKFIELGSKSKNVGIIDLQLNKLSAKVYVKNYNGEKESVTVSHVQNKKVIAQKQLSISPYSIEVAEFSVLPAISTFELSTKDDFELDNKIFLSSPQHLKIKVLLITNAKNSPIESALRASDEIELELREPPIVNPDNVEHDVIIVSRIDKTLYVPGDFVTLANYVAKEHSIVIAAQEDLKDLKLGGLLPVQLEEYKGSSNVELKVINSYTKDVELGKVNKYWKTTASNTTLPIAVAQDNSPILLYTTKEKGKIFYYGIIDSQSDFPTSVSYPIFWLSLIKNLAGSEDINDYNKRTSDNEYLKYNEIGVYDVLNKKVALNLLDEGESNIANEEKLKQVEDNLVVEEGKKEGDVPITNFILMAASLMILLKLLYIKKRGDI